MTIPAGFRVASLAAGLRYQNRLDLGLIVADKLFGSAAVFTQSRTRAAPVLWSARKLSHGRAILANAGQANAQTGADGDRDCASAAEALAPLLGLKPKEILLASTGVIGQRINMEALLKAIPALPPALAPTRDAFARFAEAIMTTDKVSKIAEETAGDPPVRILGCVKGAGMIAPNMATMLAFVITDAAVSSDILQNVLREATDRSFNRITVDGDASTNDSVFLLASGAAEAAPFSTREPRRLELFAAALQKTLDSLATAIVRDAEGGTKCVRVALKGARNEKEAVLAARAVAESLLVKTALFGSDPNWGRILAALGRSGAVFDPYLVDIDVNDVPLARRGLDAGMENAAREVMLQSEFAIRVDLHNGNGEASFLTSDLSREYVTINASYRS
ncbi:MAG: bifunctional glutamate N-acetyltransferase/amino-acid acetyltransferase ArgJ [Deltaproteobacteria bacterium]|nr:bifunctional glutamate N-acetyltransferase/amino-acid acetyltransferase ArgJ [Deltaproteobacteria bacterium]